MKTKKHFVCTSSNRPNQLGFTIIEMMITVVLLMIVSAIALPSYRIFIANTQIRSTAESIRNGLQAARGEAVKRNSIVIFRLANDTSWSFGCATSTPNCPDPIQSKSAREGSAGAISLTITGASLINFTSLGFSDATPGQLSRIDVDSNTIPATDSKELRIVIGTGGNIRICDPNVATATDPRYCFAGV